MATGRNVITIMDWEPEEINNNAEPSNKPSKSDTKPNTKTKTNGSSTKASNTKVNTGGIKKTSSAVKNKSKAKANTKAGMKSNTKTDNKRASSKSKESESDNDNTNHRRRIKEHLLAHGLAYLNDHQMIEVLLFFGIPQKDTNAIAHELLNKYGSFHEVFNGSVEELKSVNGMTENAAILISLIPQYVAALTTKKQLGKSLRNPEDMAAFFMAQYVGVKNEKILLACLDDQLRLIELIPLATGNINRVDIEIRNIATHAIRTNASQIILAHNHIDKRSSPTQEERKINDELKKTFANLTMKLAEHVIIGNDGAALMMSNLYYADYGRAKELKQMYLSEIEKKQNPDK